jgi:DNA primase
MILRETIEKIKDAIKIEEVVGEYVNLKKRGVNLIGLCPFHNEKTPSFTVSPTKGIFKCFGCGEAGSGIDFLMKHEHLTYPQALKTLADKYGIEVEEEEYTPEQEKADKEREALYVVSSFAQKHFSNNLENTEEGKAVGLTYLNQRGISDKSIEKFELGWALDKWDDLLNNAKENGHDEESLIKTGLLISNNDKTYDRFRARLMFPIHNVAGRVLGFGGRTLSKDKKTPKYVNSPESDIYSKSDVLYGLFQAKNAIVKNDNCCLVEGYTDVISLFQAGIENVVSSSGTSLTDGQIKLIKRYTNNISILYDGDPAGIKASFRGIDMIVEAGMNVRILLFPEGEDPDSFAQKHRSTEIQNYIDNNLKDFIRFKADYLSKEAGNDPVKRSELAKDIIKTIALVPDAIKRQYFVKETSQQLKIDEQLIVNEISKIRRKKYFKKEYEAPQQEQEDTKKHTKQLLKEKHSSISQERNIIRLLISYGHLNLDFTKVNLIKDDTEKTKDDDFDVVNIVDEEKDEENEKIEMLICEYIFDDIENDDIDFSDKNLKKIYNEYLRLYQEESFVPNEKYFLNHDNDLIRQTAIDLTADKYQLSENWAKKHKIFVETEDSENVLSQGVVGSMLSLKIKRLEITLEKLRAKLNDENIDEIDLNRYLESIKKLQSLKIIIEKQLGRVISF